MKEMRAHNEETCNYLFKSPRRFWSKSTFTFDSKCDVLVNNMSKTFNSVIIKARKKPIVTLVEEIIGYLMEKWETNRNKMDKLIIGSLLPRVKGKKLENI